MTSPFKFAVIAGLAGAAMCAAQPAFAIDYATISIAGFWADNAPVTAYSAPGDSFALRFKVPLSSYTTIYQQPDLSVTTDFTAYSYKLEGSLVSGLPDNITFFDAADGGGIALGYPTHSVEFFGPDIGSQGKVILGSYSFYPNMDDVQSNGSATNQGAGPALGSVVPEPAAWALMLVGFGGVGGMVRGSRGSRAAA